MAFIRCGGGAAGSDLLADNEYLVQSGTLHKIDSYTDRTAVNCDAIFTTGLGGAVIIKVKGKNHINASANSNIAFGSVKDGVYTSLSATSGTTYNADINADYFIMTACGSGNTCSFTVS